MPRVSVILPVHNGEAYIADALSSVLRQSYREFEVIAIDDGSTDSTRNILDAVASTDPRVRVYSQTNIGLTATLNRAVGLATGEFVARQDADDLSMVERLAEQVKFLDANPEVGMCGTWSWIVHPQAGVLASWEFPNDSQLLYQLLVEQLNPFVHGSVMFRRDLFLRLSDGYRFGDVAQDLDLWLRMGEISKLGMVESKQFAYFLSPGSITEQQNALLREETEMIRHLRAQRAELGAERGAESSTVTSQTPVAQPGAALATGELGWYGAAVYRLLAGDLGACRACLRQVWQLDGKFRVKARLLSFLSHIPWLLPVLYRTSMGKRVDYMRFYRAGQVEVSVYGECLDRRPSTDARVCILSYCPSLGGIANYQALQMQYLADKVPVLFLGERPRNTFQSIERAVRSKIATATAPIWTRPLECLPVLWKVLFKWRPTVVVISNLGLMIVWAPLLRWLRWRTGCEILHVYHSRRTTPSLKGYLLEILTSLAHFNASAVVYVSNYTKRAWESAYPWMRFCSARVIPNSVPIGESAAKLGRPEQFKIGFVGRLEAEKGATLFCELADDLARRGFPFKFEVFGDGSLRDELRSKFGSLVQFNGVEHDKEVIFGKLDLLVVTSRIENAPYVVLEAKAYGVPVVSARIGGVPELVADGIDGIICPERTVPSYSEAVIDAYNNYEHLAVGCMKNRTKFDINTLAPIMWSPFFRKIEAQAN